MRKLVWLFVILFIALCVVSFASFLFPPVYVAVSGTLSSVGGTVWTAITGAWASLGIFMGSTGHYFLAWTVGVAVVMLLSAATLHAFWNKHAPAKLGGQKPLTPSSGSLQGGLIQTGNQAVGPVPTGTVVAEEKSE